MSLWPRVPGLPALSAVEHAGFVLAGLLVYVLVTRIGQQRRHPSAALAWVLAIIAVPYLGVPLFLLLGTRKLARPRVPAGRVLPSGAGTANAPDWALRLLAGLGLPDPTRQEAVHFHADGRDAMSALLALIGQARVNVDVCTFVLGDDGTGEAIGAALKDAAQRGVRVRMLVDAVGSLALPARRLRSLREAGVAVRRFMPLLHNPRHGRSNLRNHRKLVTVDDRGLWSGGRNLADPYFEGRPAAPAWLDLSFSLHGPLALQARLEFERDWRLAGGEVARAPEDRVSPGISSAALEIDGALVQWVSSGPDHALDTLHALLLAMAHHARERFWVASPYMVPDEALLDALCTACYRGVQVVVLLPARSNHRLADIARERGLRELVQAGAEVRLLPQMLHAKALVLDDSMALCGSLNFDARSLFLNYEQMTAFYDPEQVGWLADWMTRHMRAGRLHEGRAPGWAGDLLEGLVRTLGFQL